MVGNMEEATTKAKHEPEHYSLTNSVKEATTKPRL